MPEETFDIEPSAERVEGGVILTDCGGMVQFVPDATPSLPFCIMDFGDEDEAA